MKKLLFIFIGLAFLVSCSDDKKEAGGMSEKAKKNLETNQAVTKMFEQGDWSKAADYIDKDAVDHGAGPTGGDIVGIDSIMANFNMMGEMMENFKVKVIKEFADDDYVMSWVEQSATAKMDIPEWGMKKGLESTYNTIEVSKFKDSKITDHWNFMTMADMMKMMGGGGQQPPMDTQPVKDPTSK